MLTKLEKDFDEKLIKKLSEFIYKHKSFEEKVLKDWEHFGKGYMSTDLWIESVFMALDYKGDKKQIDDELYKF